MTQLGSVFDALLVDRFLELPWHIIGEICDLLPSEIVTKVLLKVEEIRPIIIQRYFSGEICLFLPYTSPEVPEGEGYYGRYLDEQSMTHIVGYDNIGRFFNENPDIVPHQYTILPSEGYDFWMVASFRKLLRTFRGALRQAPALAIEFPGPEIDSSFYLTDLSQDLVDLILSFRNLVSLQTSIRPQNPNWAGWQSLRKVVYESDDETIWSGECIPPNLTELEIIMDDKWGNRREYTIPFENFYSMLWESTPNFDRVARCPALKSLTLFNCGLKCLDLSLIPSTLEVFNLRFNETSQIERTGSIARWPKNLKVLNLADNEIGDEMLEQLSYIKWPPLLEDLNLGENKIASLEHLRNLPSSLKHLDLRSNWDLKSLKVTHNHGGYPFFIFPECLEKLTLEFCGNLSWQIFDNPEAVPILHKMRFPPNLKSLNLQGCNIDTLARFIFPPALKSLDLRVNLLTSLATYDVSSGGVELSSWKQLKNLRELSVSSNRLETLEGWNPPISVQKLNLGGNMLGSLSRENFSLFDERFHEFTDNLRFLDLCANGIKTLDHDFYLPRNITYLNLSRNKFSKFEFHDSFASHENLLELDLEYNPLSRISVEHPEKKYASNLKKLDLLMREGWEKWEMSTDDLDTVFEQLGLQVVERSEEISKTYKFT